MAENLITTRSLQLTVGLVLLGALAYLVCNAWSK